jgi:hypothetical protein
MSRLTNANYGWALAADGISPPPWHEKNAIPFHDTPLSS